MGIEALLQPNEVRATPSATCDLIAWQAGQEFKAKAEMGRPEAPQETVADIYPDYPARQGKLSEVNSARLQRSRYVERDLAPAHNRRPGREVISFSPINNPRKHL